MIRGTIRRTGPQTKDSLPGLVESLVLRGEGGVKGIVGGISARKEVLTLEAGEVADVDGTKLWDSESFCPKQTLLDPSVLFRFFFLSLSFSLVPYYRFSRLLELLTPLLFLPSSVIT